MIYSPKYRYVFFAVPKTATHAVRQALINHIGDYGWQQQALFEPELSPIPSIAKIGHGHISFNQLSARVEPSIWSDYFKFAFVRNPFDRFVSICAFLNRQNSDFVGRERDWMKVAIQRAKFQQRILVRPQYEQLVDEHGALAMDFIGRYENLQKSLNAVLTHLQLPHQQLLSKNRSEHKPYREYYDTELQEMVAEFYANDFKLFDYEF